MTIKELKSIFSKCDKTQQDEVIRQLLNLSVKSRCHISIPRGTFAHKCPRCNSRDIVAVGPQKGVHRFRCKKCLKYFRETSGTLLYALKKKDLLGKYLYCLLSGFTVRESASYTGIAIQTAFDWRHKILLAFSTVSPRYFEGIMEGTTFYQKYSTKGSRKSNINQDATSNQIKAARKIPEVGNIMASDRFGNTDIKVVSIGKIELDDVERILRGRTKEIITICSPEKSEFKRFANINRIDYESDKTVFSKRIIKAAYHVNNNKLKKNELDVFMNKFHGVATKYLQNYYNWFLLLQKIAQTTYPIELTDQLLFKKENVWGNFKQKNINTFFRTKYK